MQKKTQGWAWTIPPEKRERRNRREIEDEKKRQRERGEKRSRHGESIELRTPCNHPKIPRESDTVFFQQNQITSSQQWSLPFTRLHAAPQWQIHRSNFIVHSSLSNSWKLHIAALRYSYIRAVHYNVWKRMFLWIILSWQFHLWPSNFSNSLRISYSYYNRYFIVVYRFGS